MIRAFAALSALCVLSGCGVLGPSQSDLEAPLQQFYAGDHAGAPDLAGARIDSYEGCQPGNGIYRCPVVFSTERGNVATLIWIVRGPGSGWQVRSIALNERTP